MIKDKESASGIVEVVSTQLGEERIIPPSYRPDAALEEAPRVGPEFFPQVGTFVKIIFKNTEVIYGRLMVIDPITNSKILLQTFESEDKDVEDLPLPKSCNFKLVFDNSIKEIFECENEQDHFSPQKKISSTTIIEIFNHYFPLEKVNKIENSLLNNLQQKLISFLREKKFTSYELKDEIYFKFFNNKLDEGMEKEFFMVLEPPYVKKSLLRYFFGKEGEKELGLIKEFITEVENLLEEFRIVYAES
ncbi:hypothetical protein HK099_006170 [Clydaea vesicula]|uniref:Uncharacterized protein n=1 Tax=Clydaea vesicula TaxID=447962 RepID=A0AAD5XZ88_9FUNG|nr:hypothetical protein HK099_006170 [Clydaea vesicula]